MRSRFRRGSQGFGWLAAPTGAELAKPSAISIQNRADFEHLEMKGLQAGYGIIAGKIADYLAKLKKPGGIE